MTQFDIDTAMCLKIAAESLASTCMNEGTKKFMHGQTHIEEIKDNANLLYGILKGFREKNAGDKPQSRVPTPGTPAQPQPPKKPSRVPTINKPKDDDPLDDLDSLDELDEEDILEGI